MRAKVFSLEEVAVKHTIIEQFDGEELLHKPLIDFLPYLVRNVEDMDILKSWKRFFENKGVPFIVTQDKQPNGASGLITVTKMWKERYVDDEGQPMVLEIKDDPILC